MDTPESTKRILIVDDDEAIRAILAHNLEAMGLVVVAAESAEEGWEILRRESFALVITDVRMAGMSGMDFLLRIRQQDPFALVIVVTAYGSVEQAVAALKSGAYDYVTKPFDRDALKLTVRKALEFCSVRRENRRLRLELSERFSISRIVGKSPAMRELFRTLARVSPADATVLVEGETGTGKELVARSIHYNSRRSAENFVTVNCTAIPRELLESELFGHVKGAFTGATSTKTGKFELANGGTVFLDEIGDIDLDLQKKLLRVLQQRQIDKVGAPSPQSVDVRIVAATHQDLLRLVEANGFRRDLYYRLRVVPVRLPALRERVDDIPLLVDHFLVQFNAHGLRLTDAALDALARHSWPGNVRELENAIERALILRRREDVIDVDDLTLDEIPTARSGAPESAGVAIPAGGIVMDEVEKGLIIEALRKTDGNQSAAARLLGMSRQTLIYRMQKHGIRDGRG